MILRTTPTSSPPAGPAPAPTTAGQAGTNCESDTMSNKHLANQIRAAAQRLRDAETAHQRIQDGLAKARAAIPELPSVEAVERNLADVEAEHALGEASASAVEAARSVLTMAKASASAIASERVARQALVEGLSRRVEKAQLELDSAHQSLQAAIVEWLRAELADAERKYLEVAAEVVRARARHVAAINALLDRGAPLTNDVTLAGDLVLPTIGPATAASFVAALPHEEHGIGRNLVPALLRAVGNTLEDDLADLIDPKAAGGIVAAFTRRLRTA